MLNNPHYGLNNGPKGVYNQVNQHLNTWSNHVKSWMNAPELKMRIVRYEDMVADPVKTFSEIVDFLPLDADPARVEKAVRFSDFKTLRQQEEVGGFAEKMPLSPSFFRRGKVGDWRNHLNDEQVARIIDDHREMMQRFGYLSDDGQLLI